MIPYRTVADDATKLDPWDSPVDVFERLAELRRRLGHSMEAYRCQYEKLVRSYDPFVDDAPPSTALRRHWQLFRAEQLGVLTEMRVLLESTEWP